MAVHFKKIADEIKEQLKGKEDPFVVELGCNDGIMLKHLANDGMKHLGIEPSGNVAEMARKNNVEVSEEFFHKMTAEDIKKKYGQADVICGSNVFCHIENINSVFEGVSVLLKDDGVLFFEDPYMYDIVNKSSFDQMYDEHVYYYSGLSVRELVKRHGLQLVNMVHQEVHGGSMRYYIKKGDGHDVSQAVESFVQKEIDLKMDCEEGYLNFKKNVDHICSDLKEMLRKIKNSGNRVVGYGATSKSTTLLNYAQIGPDLIDYICDITPSKIDKFTPGTHIPIKSYEAFKEDDLSHALLLAWNHKKEILKKEKDYRARGGKFITYFPKVMVE